MTPFGTTAVGQPVHRVTIGNGPLSATLLTLGIALQDVRLEGIAHSLTVGSPRLAPYEDAMQYNGTLVGPVANRIGGARARIDGLVRQFDANEGANTLHGGSAATHRQIWALTDQGATHARFDLDLPDGQGGFPGNRRLTAIYEIIDTSLTLTLTAATDAPTLLNLANHSYWRLDEAPTFAGQTLQIAADAYLPTTDTLLPTGQIAPVDGTRFDYRQPRELLAGAEGLLDTNFCLSRTRQSLRPVAWLRGTSGLTMELATTEPGLQAFDGHILDLPGIPGNDGVPYASYAGIAFEAQFWPDAPNHPDFPDITLRPGDNWQQITRWTFQH